MTDERSSETRPLSAAAMNSWSRFMVSQPGSVHDKTLDPGVDPGFDASKALINGGPLRSFPGTEFVMDQLL